MLAQVVRSGVVESVHDGAIAVVSSTGALIGSAGDIHRRFYARSAVKPFQAFVAQNSGAGLSPEHLAMICASHRGQPAHIATVKAILNEGGLSPSDLGCPAAWPLAASAGQRLWRDGQKEPAAIWHNCSGKHAGMLRACVAQGWSTKRYLEKDHPLQVEISEYLREVTGEEVGPVGVDGCGAPVFQVTVLGLARAFSRLAEDADLAEIGDAMHRFSALVSDGDAPDTRIARSLDACAKGGAEGVLGVAVRHRAGLAGKAWDGAMRGTTVGMLAALEAFGLMVGEAGTALADVARPAVLGGGTVVGSVEPVVRFE